MKRVVLKQSTLMFIKRCVVHCSISFLHGSSLPLALKENCIVSLCFYKQMIDVCLLSEKKRMTDQHPKI